MLLHLPPMDGREGPREKNGPALAGHGGEAVRDAISAAIATLPNQLPRSLTWDQGAEMAQHAQLRIDTCLSVYFCDPRSPWQRATNGLLRQYFLERDRSRSLRRRGPPGVVASARGGRTQGAGFEVARCCFQPASIGDCGSLTALGQNLLDRRSKEPLGEWLLAVSVHGEFENFNSCPSGRAAFSALVEPPVVGAL